MAKVKVWPKKKAQTPPFQVYVILVHNVFLTGVFQNRFLTNHLLFRKGPWVKQQAHGTAAPRNSTAVSWEGGRFSVCEGKSMISFCFSTSEKCKGDPMLPLLHPGISTWIEWEMYTWAARAAWPNTAIIFSTYRSSCQVTGSEHRFLHSMHAASLERESTVTLSLVCMWAACSCTSQATKPLVYEFTVPWLTNICSERGSRS